MIQTTVRDSDYCSRHAGALGLVCIILVWYDGYFPFTNLFVYPLTAVFYLSFYLYKVIFTPDTLQYFDFTTIYRIDRIAELILSDFNFQAFYKYDRLSELTIIIFNIYCSFI